MPDPITLDALRAMLETIAPGLTHVWHHTTRYHGEWTHTWTAFIGEEQFNAYTAETLYRQVENYMAAQAAEMPTEYLAPGSVLDALPPSRQPCPACDEGPGDCRGCGT